MLIAAPLIRANLMPFAFAGFGRDYGEEKNLP